MPRVEQNIGLGDDLQRVEVALKGLVQEENAELGVSVHVDDIVVEDTAVPLLGETNPVPLVQLHANEGWTRPPSSAQTSE